MEQQLFNQNGSPCKKNKQVSVPGAPAKQSVIVTLFSNFTTPVKQPVFNENSVNSENSKITWAPIKKPLCYDLRGNDELDMDLHTPLKENLDTDNYRKRKASDAEVKAIEDGDYSDI
jgi:hypothetical protein